MAVLDAIRNVFGKTDAAGLPARNFTAGDYIDPADGLAAAKAARTALEAYRPPSVGALEARVAAGARRTSAPQ